MKKWKRILSAILAVLLLSGSMPVWAAETVDPDEQAGDIQELKEKLEGLIPEEELGKYTKRNLSERQGLEGKWNTTSFLRRKDRRQRSHRDAPCIRFLEYNRVQCKNRNRNLSWILCRTKQSHSIGCVSGLKVEQ